MTQTVTDELIPLHRQPGFPPFVTARLFASLAMQIQAIIVAWQVYAITKDPLTLGYVGLAQFLPMVILLLPAGDLVDRVDRRLLLHLSWAVQALCSAFLEGAQAHSDISLRSLLEEEIQGAIEAASCVDVSVSLRCGARMYAHAPEVAVRRFVQNALSNSLAASPKGSGLLVEVLSAGRGVLELAVEDQGGGLSAEEVMRCFRLGGSGRGSTGVGSESQLHAAEALGSSLTVRTAPGAGTRVSVRMRAARSDRPVAILLDQDATLRDQVMASLASAGWWVVPADSVSDAVGGLDRWDASLAVHRRGARGGSAGPLHRVASDLQIRCVELPAGDVGQGLPSPAEACV